MSTALIIIPAYNEATTIGGVLEALQLLRLHEDNTKELCHSGADGSDNQTTYSILVIDDGSHDDTNAMAQQYDCVVLRHSINRGLGAALRTGFAYAQICSYDYIVTFDGDGQHSANDIPRIMAKLQEGYDVVIGSRMHTTHKMPLLRVIANKIGNLVTLGGHISTDSQSGLRGFKQTALAKLELCTDRMEISSEIIEEVWRKKLKYGEISIEPIYTDYSLSKGQSFLVGLATWWRLILVRYLK